ncbi:isochorismate synthase [Gordonia sp. PP30]|uniref:isochorismate synthase n=1 Tax=Gordonia sp. PP30 TaxID=2935861 RepID=UPI001FFE7FBC|nr:isochorismate synthase [Gordonia sp. PP30]UQE76369.1 isochorismate synthase [Gordonia sp. PP30]
MTVSTTAPAPGRDDLADDAGRKADRPDFLLCRNGYRAVAHGRAGSFDDAAEAAEALRSGRAPAVTGALPFDIREAAALSVPRRIDVVHGAWAPGPVTLGPSTRIARLDPPLDEHRRRVTAAVAALADPGTDLQKVVLARSVLLDCPDPIGAWELAAALRAQDPAGSVFVTGLAPAGRPGALVGASPEVLVRKTGTTVSAHPLAGSAPRSADPAVDDARRRALAGSPKDHAEHGYVVAAIADALAPLCRRLDVPARPELMSTPAMWHLGTPITGELADPTLTALDLALAVHPTPAICGTPTRAARDHILATESSRGFYSGAVGWARAGHDGGDGEWMVSIRCAEVSGDGRSIRTWAGGGIVADSDPDSEVAETEAKLATVLRAVGVERATR